MNNRLGILRLASSWIAPLLGALLAFAPFAGALHHHDDGSVHEVCVACTIGHAPGVEASPAPRVEAPVACDTRVPVAPVIVAQRRLLAPTASRAPPLG